nr:hypothetical protein BaRGS_019647 [Batillaria attramentaria]
MPVLADSRPGEFVGILSKILYNCSHPYIVPETFFCDMVQQCVGGEDEPADCKNRSRACGDWIPSSNACLKIVMDVENVTGRDHGYCIPTYMLNNDEQDCPHGEDENIPHENFTCPGFYRCYLTGNCLHSDYVCDGIYHCPNKDDERYCCLVGAYAAVIGTADAVYRGQYALEGPYWKQSGVCKLAGVLVFVSSEMSLFSICLLTLDCSLMLRSQHRLTRRSALIVCGAAWLICVALATVPFIREQLETYEQTGICNPLMLIEQSQFEKQAFPFSMFHVLNVVLMSLAGIGQVVIVQSIHTSTRATKENRRRDIDASRRVFPILITDVCFWFFVGMAGLLASRGMPFPGVVNVWCAILLLPLSSAINPFLYTLHVLYERLAEKRRQKRAEQLMRKLRTDLRSWPRDKLEQHVRCCLTANLVDKTRVLHWLGVEPDRGQHEDIPPTPSHGPQEGCVAENRELAKNSSCRRQDASTTSASVRQVHDLGSDD